MKQAGLGIYLFAIFYQATLLEIMLIVNCIGIALLNSKIDIVTAGTFCFIGRVRKVIFLGIFQENKSPGESGGVAIESPFK